MTSTSNATDTPPVFLDVRSLGEFQNGHLEGALHLPLDQLQHGIGRLVPDRGQPLVLYCASGARSAFGCSLLQQLGYQQARNGGGLGLLAMTTQRAIRRS